MDKLPESEGEDFSFTKHRAFLSTMDNVPTTRMSGRTLAFALSQLAQAIIEHDRPLQVRNHSVNGQPPTEQMNKLCLEEIIKIAKALNLEGFKFAINPHPAVIFCLPYFKPPLKRKTP